MESLGARREAAAEPDEIRRYLQVLVASRPFAGSRRRSDLLRYLVDRTLAGQQDQITEYGIALDVFQKPPSFDPRIDSHVRTEMARLRRVLAEHYEDAGAADPWRIEFPSRGYVPAITPTHTADHPSAPQPAEQPAEPPPPPSPVKKGWFAAAAMVLVAVAAGLGVKTIASSLKPPPLAIRSTARDLYLKGHAYIVRRDFNELDRAITYFKAAIARKPDFAAAYAGLAQCYILQALYGAPADRVMAGATDAATTAAALDPNNADANASLGAVRAIFQWDWPGARRELERALQLDPDNVQAHQWYADMVLTPQGSFQSAIIELERARKLDPDASNLVADEGWVYHFDRQYDRAIGLYRQALEMDPASAQARSHLSGAFEQQGNYTAWIAEWPNGWGDASQAELRKRYIQSGSTALANWMLDQTLKAKGRAHTGRTAALAASIGRADLAIEELQFCYRQHDFFLIYLAVDPAFDNLRSDPRFQEILRGVGLPTHTAAR